jgi:hypothetical protein
MAEEAGLNQFLTPEAMITPGAAGALTMMITNALALNFDTHRALTGLVISFLFGALVFVAARSFLQRSVYYVVNSLIIFCVALGANTVGAAKVASLAIAPAALAQGVDETESNARIRLLEETLRAEREAQRLKSTGADQQVREIEVKQQKRLEDLANSPSTDKGGKAFFKQWKF